MKKKEKPQLLDDELSESFEEKEKNAAYSELALDATVADVLSARGILQFYKHQAEGIEKARAGENIVISAPTASGKTEIYMIPVVEAALHGECSLLLFPTKALARDQLERFRDFALLGVRAEVYDGDTSQHTREKIRASFPQIMITNVDMLHFMLLRQTLFREFFKKLRFVIVDEIHTYSGAFGAHSANVFRRLKRIASKHERELQFLCCSATIGNAREFAEQLIEEKFSLVEAKWAPKPKITHYICNPQSESYTTKSVSLAEQLLQQGKKLLLFGNSHAVVERIGIMAREKELSLCVYRSGLDSEHRKQLERDFKNGKISALATTSALELGMDIGSVDAVILAGFPGTITRVKQRIGRAGRKGQPATAIFVARENPLDQFYVENVREYARGEVESCYLNADNEHILKQHILAMARDFPLEEEELKSEAARKIFNELKTEESLRQFAGGWIPQKHLIKELRKMNMRGAGSNVRILNLDEQKIIGSREEHMAIGELFPGAIYLHGGEKFISRSLDLEEKIARVQRLAFETSEYTTALREKSAEEIEIYKTRRAFGGKLHFGKVHISEQVYGYARKFAFNDAFLEKRELEEPLNYEFDTLAIWFDMPESIVSSVGDFADALHAFEHVSIAMMPALTGADSSEFGGISYPYGRTYVYDGIPGGAGLTSIVYEKFEAIEKMAARRINSCKCESGCPSCILDPMCGNMNRNLSKEGAREIFALLFDK
ncbi:MAG: DEAD/DEAH box helicase [Candidatus Micrarchaeota archaeon]